MDSAIHYRPANRADVDQLVSLMNEQYSRKKTAAYFEWQFFQSVLPTVLMIAEIDNKIIGMFGLQKKFLSNGACVGQLIDLLIAPKNRGQGIFGRLAEKTLSYCNDIQALAVFPNKNGKRACEKNLGMVTIAKIDNLKLTNLKINNHIKKENCSQNNSQLVKLLKDDKWRNWRYNLHPEYSYKKILLDNGSIMMTKIFSDPQTKIQYGDIVETNLMADKFDDFQKLLKLSLTNFLQNDISVITTWALPHTYLYDFFKNCGFTGNLQERYFCLKIIDQDYNDLSDINNWDLAQIDAEIY
ncbi:MAG: GNAT family N-acetyltransferase [Parcubacteria group bacterium]